MEKRNSKQPRSATQGTKQAMAMGRYCSSSHLAHPLQQRTARGTTAEHGCGGCFALPRTGSVDDEETCLLLPRNADVPCGKRMTLPPSLSPPGSGATSYPVSPPSDMFCSHGATSDSFSPCSPQTMNAPAEGGQRRGKETLTPRDLELDIRHLSLQELPVLQKPNASDDISGSLSALRNAHAKLTAAMHKQAFRSSDRPSSGESDSSEDDSSEMESAINEHLRRAKRRSRGSDRVHLGSDNEENDIEARLEQWAEARTVQLLRKLKTKEEEISEWENLKAAKARMQLREFEVKLEEKREKAMERMQRSLLSARRKAEKKKSKERASADRKVMEVVGTLEKRGGSSRKMPCKLICL